MLSIRLVDRIKKVNFLFIFKSGLGSALAIFIANRLGLLYSASAGIITLLTIQNTRRETLNIALKRIYAFILAVGIAYLVFKFIGYRVMGFGIFIIIFVALASMLNIEVGITMNSVIVSHFLVEQRMDLNLIKNEALLLLIGMGIGILVNSIMTSNLEQIKKDQKVVEDKMRKVLTCMARMLEGKEDCNYVHAENYAMNFGKLNKLIDSLLKKAYEDAGNTLIRETRYRISYLEMRRRQVAILEDIRANIEEIHDVLPQSIKISDYINKVSAEFTESNNVKTLLEELDELYQFFREEDLPTSRKEFENRAILFIILKDLEYFLKVKRSFIQKQ